MKCHGVKRRQRSLVERVPRKFTPVSFRWSQAESEFDRLLIGRNTSVSETIRAFRAFLGDSDVMAYLVMMTIRLVELHRVLKPTGLLFLHCDPTASHYLKVMMDTIFGGDRYINELIWRRTGAHNSTRSFGQIHDVIHVYSKTAKYKCNVVRRPYLRECFVFLMPRRVLSKHRTLKSCQGWEYRRDGLRWYFVSCSNVDRPD